MSTKKTDLVWNTVAVESMPKPLAAKYAEYKALQAKANTAREAFETAFIPAAQAKGMVQEGRKLVFGYRFGKLSVALAPEAEEKTTGKNLISF